MNRHTRALAVLTLGAACAIAAAAPAGAADFTTHSKLRVEGADQALDAGANYSNASISTQNSSACGQRDSRSERLRGANAMGLVGHAARQNAALTPFRTSDTFDFGLIVCKIGELAAFGTNQAWLYKANHEFASVGGDQLRVGRDDEVLWYFANFGTGQNTGDELDLRGVPRHVEPSESFEVRAVAYDGEGLRTDAEGVTVTGGEAPALTNAGGSATVTAPADDGVTSLRGSRGDDIPTAPVEVCVDDDPSQCPVLREDFYGTDRQDLILGSGGPDTIKPRGRADRVRAGAGDDYVYAFGNGPDRVACGAGHDVVERTPGEDDVAADCEEKRLP